MGVRPQGAWEIVHLLQYFSAASVRRLEWRRSPRDHVFMIMINDRRSLTDSSYCPLCDLSADLFELSLPQESATVWDAPCLPSFLPPGYFGPSNCFCSRKLITLWGVSKGVGVLKETASYPIQIIKIFSYILYASIGSQRSWLWGQSSPRNGNAVYLL